MTTLATLGEPVKPDGGAAHNCDHLGSLLRRLRAGCEAQMTPDFNPTLSLLIDDLVQLEESQP
jgi:hypothetical protein